MKSVPAIYENGVFRPLEKVELPEATHVNIPLPETAKPPMRPGLAAIYEVLSRRFDSDRHDLAERHDEHQP
ncbi:MAG TPA: antitoxin family protein [Chthoniobacteraceae bacterium]|jgi:predicted DNA-binding antitoxin AbrB/MazE fold protein|nr:antitoxin family protein [Chthoniobacteraceae bacterium]